MSRCEPINRTHRRDGIALLEVLVGITLLAVVGSAWVALEQQIVESARTLREREQRMRAAEATLERIMLWDRGELAPHLGKSYTRGFVLGIESAAPDLWSITISDSTSEAVVLSTAMYAHEPHDVAPAR